MVSDDDEPRKPVEPLRKLDQLSIADLERLIVELEREIARIRAAIAEKQKIRSGADALFGRKG